MPQTREHVEVLDLLGVSRAVVALNKIDLVDEELAELAAEELSEFLESTRLAGAPVIPVSAETGAGIEDLRAALTAAAEAIPPRSDRGSFRLPIDRVFTLKGMGTVVTGTSWSGSVGVGDTLELLPRGKNLRVRDLQVHDESVERAMAGQRTAIALHGIKHDELERGELLATPGRFKASSMMSLRVEALASNAKPLRQRSRIRFHFGTQEVLGRLVLLDRDELPPGEQCLAQARLEAPAVAAPGDRIILRFYSPMRTVAGATVVESEAPKRRSGHDGDLEAVRLREAGDPAEILERACLEAGMAGFSDKEALPLVEKYGDAEVIGRLLGEGTLLRLGKSLFHGDCVERLVEEIRRRAGEMHEARPLAWGPSREHLRSSLAPELPQASFQKLLEHLEGEGRLRLRGEAVRASEEDPAPTPALAPAVEAAEAAWREAGLAALNLVRDLEPDPDLVDYLAGRGTLIRIDGDAGLLRGIPGIDEIRNHGRLQELHLARGADSQEILAAIMAKGRVRHFELSRPSLHDIFVRIAGPEAQAVVGHAEGGHA